MKTRFGLAVALLLPAVAQAGPNEDLFAAIDAEYGGFQSAEQALKDGADVNARDKARNTPLIIASARGTSELVKLLIVHGADVIAENSQGRDALKVAVEAGNPETIAALENELGKPKVKAARRLQAERKAAATTPGERLQASAGTGDLPGVKRALDAGAEVNALDAKSTNPYAAYTPLIAAARNGHAAVVEALLAKAADVNLKIGFGMTALHAAAQFGHVDVVRLLLVAKADVNARDSFGNTPLIVAADNQQLSTMQLLLDARADPHLRNNDSSNALNRALATGHAPAVALLRAAGVKEVEPLPVKLPPSAPASRPIAAVPGKPAMPTAAPTQRQAEILAEIAAAERKIAAISEELAQLPGALPSAPVHDRKTITGQSCDRLGNNCTNTYQGGTESVGSFYARTSGGKRPQLENELAQFNARRDFWVAELRKLDP